MKKTFSRDTWDMYVIQILEEGKKHISGKMSLDEYLSELKIDLKEKAK